MNPMCPTNDGIEDTEHFLLLCPSFDNQRQDLLAGVSELLRPFVQIETLPNNVLIQYLLYGNEELPNDVNRKLHPYNRSAWITANFPLRHTTAM